MSHYTKQDIIRLVEENNVEFIRLQFTDVFGTLKNVAITAKQLEKALDNKCMFDGSSVDGFVRIDESDMYLYPDLDTFSIFTWRSSSGRVARLICDVYRPDGVPFQGDPRGVLKRVLRKAVSMGYNFCVGPELEFFLFHTDEEGRPTTVTHEKAGYFDVAPLDLGENARRDIVLTLEEMGFDIEASHHEVAPAQHEIDLLYANALKTADNIIESMMNDSVAFAAYKAASELKIKIPGQLKVISYGDYNWSSFPTIGLTTYEQHFTKYGKEAIRLLLHRMQGDAPLIQQRRVIKYDLQRRSSF